MDPVPPEYNAHVVESEILTLWRGRRLPPPGGVLGPPTGPTVRQYVGAWTQGDFPSLVAHRAVAADVDARYLELMGRRAVATLRQGTAGGSAAPSAVPSLLTALGVWTGGDGATAWDAVDRTSGVQAIVGRLASKGILATRDEAFRMCPSCGSPRSPERIIYEERDGDTFLVRFPVRFKERTVNALVWVDVPWKLLGTSALLVNPEFPYVVADYRRRDDRELVLTSKASLDRLLTWIPESTFEVVEDHPGRAFQGTAYVYPLRTEFPIGGDLAAPAGTILTAADVTDTGTGIVPLVPGHGPTDGRIAARIGVNGWPLVTPKGKLDFTLLHKYAGLDLESANEFVLRDLSEAGALLARLRVKRGVPLCAICGTALLWAPGRAWCLEPSRLPPERRELFSRLLPEETLPGPHEVAPWPVSEALSSDDPSAVALLECPRCDRLEVPDGSVACPCGGQRRVVRRRLLPSSGGAFSAWARFDPFPDGDSIHLYVGYRRRVPSLVNHLAALCGVQGFVGDVNLTVVPTVAAANAPELVVTFGADAVRAALIRSGLADAATGSFAGRCRQEADRIRRWWRLAEEVVGMCDPAMLAAFARPIGGFLGDLEVEDRAILARWERTRTLALAHYDHWAPALVHRRAFRFLDNDLMEYRELVAPRLALVGTPSSKRAALRTLAHLLRGLSEVLAPILPFTSEAMHRTLSAERTSLFEQPMAGLDRALLNDELVAAWDRWEKVLRSLARFRRSLGVPRSTALPSVVLVLPADDLGDRFRAEKEIVARLAGIERLEVASPREPWTGRQRTVRPIESEIQKAYPAEASQIVHLLQRMAPRRWETAAGQDELTVVINGLPRRVFPNMVALSDTLPDRVVPVPCPIGEMYVELPVGAVAARARAPPLSADAFWLVRRIERRLRSAGPIGTPPERVVLVTAKDPLASELRSAAEPIGRYLGVRELRVVEKSEEPVPPNAMTGRTHTGDRWWAHVPGLPPPRAREKKLCSGARMQRVSVSVEIPPAEFDYADEKFVAHEEDVRALGQELDDILGVPLLGPAKVAGAWERGIHSVDDLRQASFETVSGLPGFGGRVAEVVVTKLGGTVPIGVSRRAREVPATPRRTTAPKMPTPTAAVRSTLAAPSSTGASATAPTILSPSPVELPDLVEPAPSGPTEPVLPALSEEVPRGPDVTESPPTGATEGTTAELALATDTAPASASPEPIAVTTAEAEPSMPDSAPTPAVPAVAGTEPLADVEISEPEAPTPEEVGEAAVPEIPGESAELTSSVPEMELVAPEQPGSVPENPLPEPEMSLPDEASAEPRAETAPVATETIATAESPPSGMESNPEVTAPEVVTTAPAEEEAPPSTELGGPETAAPTSEIAEVPPTPEVPPPIVSSPKLEPTPVELPSEPEPTPAESPPEPVPTPVELPPEPESTPAESPPEPVATPVELPSEPESTPAESPPELLPTSVPATTPQPESSESESPAEEVMEESQSPPSPEATVPSPIAETLAPQATVPTTEVVQPAPRTEPERAITALKPALSSMVALPPPVVSPPTVDLPPTPAEPEPPSPPAGVELMVGDSLVASLAGFLEAASAGHRGVCVIRETPERIRARVGSRPVEVYWLTNIGRGPALRPSDLEGAWTFLARKLVDERVTAFFLEGVEYLVRLHGVDSVINGLVEFDRLARENDARIWVYLAPSLMKPEDLDRFRSTFGGGTMA
jgi:anticodon-binding protein/uncharacterized protein DUF835